MTCSVLALGTSNRLARVVDRTRVVAAELAGFEPGTSNYKDSFMQLDHLQVRATSAEGFEAFLRVDRPICRRGSSIGDRLNRDLLWAACSLSTSRGARARHRVFGGSRFGLRLLAHGARDPLCGTKLSGRGEHPKQTPLSGAPVQVSDIAEERAAVPVGLIAEMHNAIRLCGFVFRSVGFQRFLQLHFQNAVHGSEVGDQVAEVQE